MVGMLEGKTWRIKEFCADVSESDIRVQDEEVLRLLLVDRTMTAYNGRWTNIKWCTDDYAVARPGIAGFAADDEIRMDQISSGDGVDLKVITPRIAKNAEEQHRRSVQRAEVFTPSWVCNEQNNLIDQAWFGRDQDLFNEPNPYYGSSIAVSPEQNLRWKPLLGAKHFIKFSRQKSRSREAYVKSPRLEVSCGEAPYLTSRYDTTQLDCWIHPHYRIGILDRKLRVISEKKAKKNFDAKTWCAWASEALKSCYGFEWQGDNIILARENMLYAALEYFKVDFKNAEVPIEVVREWANIISWNIWQMDGIRQVVPNTCHETRRETPRLDGTCDIVISQCPGCKSGDVTKHNGVRCLVKDWAADKTIIFGD